MERPYINICHRKKVKIGSYLEWDKQFNQKIEIAVSDSDSGKFIPETISSVLLMSGIKHKLGGIHRLKSHLLDFTVMTGVYVLIQDCSLDLLISSA